MRKLGCWWGHDAFTWPRPSYPKGCTKYPDHGQPFLCHIRTNVISAPFNPENQAMVRPRIGDFLYSEEELDVMLEDIGLFKSLGIAGVVFGVLSRDGAVDVSHTRMYVFDDLFTMLRLHK